MAWRQAEALHDAGIRRTYALAQLLRMIETGEVEASQHLAMAVSVISTRLLES
jgi:hypothetical protein